MIETARLGTQLLGLRAGILIPTLPLVALLYAVGVAEGMRQWANRRKRIARESASLYHRAKIGQVVVLAVDAHRKLTHGGADDFLDYLGG